MAELYCTFRSRENIKAVSGPNSCKGCDIRAIEMANNGREPEDFPLLCSYCTDSREKALAKMADWKRNSENRERKYEELKKEAEEMAYKQEKMTPFF